MSSTEILPIITAVGVSTYLISDIAIGYLQYDEANHFKKIGLKWSTDVARFCINDFRVFGPFTYIFKKLSKYNNK